MSQPLHRGNPLPSLEKEMPILVMTQLPLFTTTWTHGRTVQITKYSRQDPIIARTALDGRTDFRYDLF
jgi:hypothetical protein